MRGSFKNIYNVQLKGVLRIYKFSIFGLQKFGKFLQRSIKFIIKTVLVECYDNIYRKILYGSILYSDPIQHIKP